MKNQFLHFWLLIRRLGLLVAIFMLLRIIFYMHNAASFTNIGTLTVINILSGGIRFDLTTIIYLNIVFILLHILPLPIRNHDNYQRMLKFLFLFINIPAVLISLIDTAYFPFNNKRITSDILGVSSAGLRNIFHFLAEYWFLFLLFLIIIYINE